MSSEDIAEKLSNALNDDECARVEQLIANGADVNQADAQGTRPLQHAAESGCTRCLTLLLSRGAEIEAVDKRQKKPLELAIEHDCPNIVDLLLLHGANIGTTGDDGASATIKTMLQKAQHQRHNVEATVARIMKMDEERKAKALNAERITQGVFLADGRYGAVHAGVWHLPDVESEDFAPSVRFVLHVLFQS